MFRIPPKQIEDVLLAYSPESFASTKPEAKEGVVVLEFYCGKPVTSVFGELWEPLYRVDWRDPLRGLAPTSSAPSVPTFGVSLDTFPF